MGGLFSAGGLITGIDSNNLIRQLLQLERAPITRIRERIDALESRRDAIRELRTQFLTLRNRTQDFRLGMVFNQFQSTSNDETILTADVQGGNPAIGAYEVEVTQLASATVATSSGTLGAAINAGATLDSSGIATTIEAGTFSINGVSFNVDPAVDSLNDIVNAINASAAGVRASYDAGTDTVSMVNDPTPGDPGDANPPNTSIINFGASGDTSNFLAAIAVEGATQTTDGDGATTVTSTRNLGAVAPQAILNTVNFDGGAVTAGSFFVNGVSISVDPTVDTLGDIIGKINASDAGVTATIDTATDTIRVVSDTLGSRTVSFISGTSNFLTVANLDSATQVAGSDSQFKINGGAVQTRNTNEVADAIGGVILNFLSLGTSTVTLSADDDAIVEKIQEFIDAFNESITQVHDLTGRDGDLHGDGTIRSLETFLRANIFKQVTGISGNFQSLIDIGISTGDTFDSSRVSVLEIDDDLLREALRENRGNVQDLFANDGETGIADLIFPFLNEITRFTGTLNERAKANGSIDRQIDAYNRQIESVERRVAHKERRLRAQFTRLEQISAGFQAQNAALANLSFGFRVF